MPNANAKTASTAMVDYRARAQAMREKMKGSVSKTNNMIGTAGKAFKLPSGESSPGPMNVIVLSHRPWNQLYEGAYSASEVKPPICQAMGIDLETMAPHETVKKPKHENCLECPMNQWQSAPNGKGKACKNQYVLAVVGAADLNKDEDPEIYTLKVAPTGMKNFNKFFEIVDAKYELPPMGVITEISFNAHESYPQLLFRELGEHGTWDKVGPLVERAEKTLENLVG